MFFSFQSKQIIISLLRISQTNFTYFKSAYILSSRAQPEYVNDQLSKNFQNQTALSRRALLSLVEERKLIL